MGDWNVKCKAELGTVQIGKQRLGKINVVSHISNYHFAYNFMFSCFDGCYNGFI